MALSASQTVELNEIKEEISLIENRLKVSHAIGDSNSSLGVSATFNDNKEWRKQLARLRNRRNQLENIEAGIGNTLADVGITTINLQPQDNPLYR